MQAPRRIASVIAVLAGVDLVGAGRIRLRCNACGSEWSPTSSGEKGPAGSWICPQGCNAPAASASARPEALLAPAL